MKNPPYVPPEIIERALSYLPVKTLVRFLSASKSFQAIIESPVFITSHLSLSNRENMLFMDTGGMIYCLDVMKEEGRLIELPEPTNFEESFQHFIGSCNGLVLLECVGVALYILNPMTKLLEKASQIDSPKCDECTIGLGFDINNREYKIVAVCDDTCCDRSNIHLYSFSTKQWRVIGPCPFIMEEGYQTSHGVFDSGFIHFLAKGVENDNVIVVAFNFQTESFEIVVPPTVGVGVGDEFELTSLSVLKGRLCLIYTANVQMQVWAMRVYGDKNSWTKLFEMDFDGDCVVRMLKPLIHYYSNNVVSEGDEMHEIAKGEDGEIENILLFQDSHDAYYDPASQNRHAYCLIRYFVVSNIFKWMHMGDDMKILSTISFVESLVRPS